MAEVRGNVGQAVPANQPAGTACPTSGTSGRQELLFFQQIGRWWPAGGSSSFLAEGPDPVQIAALPDIGKTNQQDSKKGGDIDDYHPGNLPGPFVDPLIGQL